MRNMKTKLLRKIRERFLYEFYEPKSLFDSKVIVYDLEQKQKKSFYNVGDFLYHLFCSSNDVFRVYADYYRKSKKKRREMIANAEWNRQLKGHYQRAQQTKAIPSIMRNKLYIPKEYKAVSKVVTYSEHLQEQHEKQQSEISELKKRISELENQTK